MLSIPSSKAIETIIYYRTSLKTLWLYQSKRGKAWIPIISEKKKERWRQMEFQFQEEKQRRLQFEERVKQLAERIQLKKLNSDKNVTRRSSMSKIEENRTKRIQSAEDLKKLFILIPEMVTLPKRSILPSPMISKSSQSTVHSEKIQIANTTSPSPNNSVFESLEKLKTSPYTAFHFLTNLSSPALCNSDLPITIHLNIEIDLKRESLRGLLRLPYSTGEALRIVAFCPDDIADDMISAGADFAGEHKIIDKIFKGFSSFDKCITTAEFMPKILKLAKILGPKRLMPNKKSGTVVANLLESIEELKSGSFIEYRAVDDGVISLPIGKLSSDPNHLIANTKALCLEVPRNRPGSSQLKAREEINRKKWPPQKRDICTEYFNAPDIRALIKPIRQCQYNLDLLSSNNSNKLFKSGSLTVPGLPTIFLMGEALDPSSTGFTTNWGFR